MLKLSAAVTGRRARSAECCWHVASTLLGEYIQGVCVEGRVCVSGEGGMLAFGAAVAVLMAMMCKNKRIAAAAVELSCWS